VAKSVRALLQQSKCFGQVTLVQSVAATPTLQAEDRLLEAEQQQQPATALPLY
jgi:hypothetical protein